MFIVVCFLVVGCVLGVFEDEGVVGVDEVLCEGFVDVVCGCGVVVGFDGVVHVFCEDVCECFDCSLCGCVDVDVGGVAVECDGDVLHRCCLSCFGLCLRQSHDLVILPYNQHFVL